MPEEIIPGLFRLPIPLPNDSLGSVNVYAAVSADGLRLIDSGWNAPEAYTALLRELRELGMQVSDIKEILLTHNHPDHIGLAERFVREAGARLLLHLDSLAPRTHTVLPRGGNAAPVALA